MCVILATVMAVIAVYCLGIGSPTGEVLRRIAPGALDAMQAGVSGYLAPWVWDVLAAGILAQPAWTFPAGLAVGFSLAAMLPAFRVAARRGMLAVTAGRVDPARGG